MFFQMMVCVPVGYRDGDACVTVQRRSSSCSYGVCIHEVKGAAL